LRERIDLFIAENAAFGFCKRRHERTWLAVHNPISPEFRAGRFRQMGEVRDETRLVLGVVAHAANRRIKVLAHLIVTRRVLRRRHVAASAIALEHRLPIPLRRFHHVRAIHFRHCGRCGLNVRFYNQ